MPGGASGRTGLPGAPTASITPVITGTLGLNGWYTSDVTVNWVLDPPPLNSTGCEAITLVADTADTPLTCSAEFPGGVEIVMTIHISRDATPPAVWANRSRAPDANGWYNHPLTVAFSGTDVSSGIDSCTRATYAGPDNVNAVVGGSCRDFAGNQATAGAALKYDATAPTIGLLVVKPRKGSGELHWRVSPDTQLVQVARSPGKKGKAESLIYAGPGTATSHLDRGLRPGRNYRYQLTGSDEAANKATRTVTFMARGALLNPAPAERVSSPPLLIWAPVEKATYYNVQLIRGRKVYSAWPVRSRLQLPRTWVYHGRHYRLRAGLYRWYVWPGFGKLSAGRYGRMLGGSSFTVSG